MGLNSKGTILIVVAILSLVMMVVALGIVSLTSSQSLSNQHQIDRLKAEQVGKGAFWYNYMSLVTTGNPREAPPVTLDRKVFRSVLQIPAASGSVENYNIDVNYN